MQRIRVLDLSSDDAGAFCTRMLSSVGADVSLLEPEGGHPLRSAQPLLADGSSATWEYLQAYKEVLDASPTVDEVELAAGYDVVVFSDEVPDPGLSRRISALRDAHEQLVVVAITGFGLTGPRSGWRAGPLEHWAAGGMMSLNGERDREPLPGGGPWATRLVGATAAIGAQVAVINARTSGVGDVWQVHRALHENAAFNTAEHFIANLVEEDDCRGHWIKASVEAGGRRWTLTNGRTGETRRYESK